MKSVRTGVDHVSAPKDYADLFSTYYPYVVALVRGTGIEDNRKEDVAMEILLRFYERGFLEKFDPTLVFEYEGELRPARFKSFLSKFVLTYVQGHGDRQRRQASRELLICDMPVGAAGDSTWIDVFGASVPDHEHDVLEALRWHERVAELRAYLAQVPRRSSYDSCDLVALFDAMVAQLHHCGHFNFQALGAQFGISSTAMHSWVWWLRANLATALGRPVPPKRPRTPRRPT